jgi:hypothetical protein
VEGSPQAAAGWVPRPQVEEGWEQPPPAEAGWGLQQLVEEGWEQPLGEVVG